MSRIQSASSDAFENDSDMDFDQNDDPEFQVKTSKKNAKSSKLKRALLLSSSSTSPKTPKKKQQTQFVTENRFSPISPATTATELASNQSAPTQLTSHNIETDDVQPIPAPPPIFVSNIDNFIKLRTDLINLIGTNNFSFKSTSKNLKIETKDSDAYRKVIRYLKENQIEHHTYQAREDRAFRIVVRNLHPSTPTSEVGVAITEIGYSVRNVSNVLHKTSRQPLPLFFVDLDPAEINKDIFHLKNLLHTKISIEEPHKRRELIQCTNCQDYGHSKTYCAHPPRCVRCVGQHLTANCTQSKDQPPTCTLCGGNHTASYRGCSTHKNLQRLHRNSSLYFKNSKTKINNVINTNNVSVGQDPSVDTPQTTQITQDLNAFPPLPKKTPPETLAKKKYSQRETQNPTQENNTENLMSSFLTEMKLLINPLIQLLTTVINKLISNDEY